VAAIFARPFDVTAAWQRRHRDHDGTDELDVADLAICCGTRSMLLVKSGPFSQGFLLLETIREFAVEQAEWSCTIAFIMPSWALPASWCTALPVQATSLCTPSCHGERAGAAGRR
jgi:hypothetical protein